jgi:hypothetical protein
VLFNDVRPQSNSSVVFTTGGLSLMVGSLLLSLSAISVYRLNQAQDVTINTSSWTWMNEVHLRLDAGQEPLGPQMSEAVVREQEFIGPEAPLMLARVKTKTQSKKHWLAKAKAVFRRGKPPIQGPESKAIVITQTQKSKPETPPIQTPSTEQPQLASAQELDTLESLHQHLRGSFLLAMTTQPAVDQVLVAQMGPQPAAVEVAPEPLTIPKRHNRSLVHRKKLPHREIQETIVQQVLSEKETPAPVVEAQVTTQAVAVGNAMAKTDSEPAQKMSPDLSQASTQDHIDTSQSAPETQAAAPIADYSIPSVEPTVAKTQVAKEKPAETESGKILVSSGSRTVWVNPSVQTVQNNIQAKVPPRAPTSAPVAPATPMTTQPVVAAMNTHRSQGLFNALSSTKSTNDYSPKASPQAFTEAFDWVSSISGGTTSYLSKEAGPSHSGWILSQAQDHWPTLSRRSAMSIPLISKNTGKLLSALAGTPIEAEAGIVFGKIPSGWSVRLSGRSERPVFLNERNQTISPSNLEGERYFAFLNVAPGAHLMYLADHAGIEEGAIGVAILGGTATYADLISLRKSTITGKVLDGSDAQVRSMVGVTVRVLGAVAAHTETSRGGRFNIENVLTVGDYPVYVETDAPAGYTHRYQLSPSQLQNATLYRLSDAAIQTWINQLEGAISPDSGIVIAAAPGVLSAQPAKTKLTPIVQSLAPSPTLRPEVYTLSPAGQMQVGESLDAQNTRFISVQVPEGPAVARLIDPERPTDQNLIWSELIMASPAVVNIIGPY